MTKLAGFVPSRRRIISSIDHAWAKMTIYWRRRNFLPNSIKIQGQLQILRIILRTANLWNVNLKLEREPALSALILDIRSTNLSKEKTSAEEYVTQRLRAHFRCARQGRPGASAFIPREQSSPRLDRFFPRAEDHVDQEFSRLFFRSCSSDDWFCEKFFFFFPLPPRLPVTYSGNLCVLSSRFEYTVSCRYVVAKVFSLKHENIRLRSRPTDGGIPARECIESKGDQTRREEEASAAAPGDPILELDWRNSIGLRKLADRYKSSILSFTNAFHSSQGAQGARFWSCWKYAFLIKKKNVFIDSYLFIFIICWLY